MTLVVEPVVNKTGKEVIDEVSDSQRNILSNIDNLWDVWWTVHTKCQQEI